ncbi:MAG: hypothetical protein QOF78_489 [Phycisphaerales bacterium]|jgi:hypothetical protein|nr:hypothetical protein [Phycisphaerales bacterium]
MMSFLRRSQVAPIFFLLSLACGFARIAAAAAPTQPATAGIVDRSTPQAAMAAMSEALGRGDEQGLVDGMQINGDADGKLARAIAHQMVVGQTFWRAMWKQWGRREAVEAYVKRGIALPDAYVEWPLVQWKIEGDKAFADSSQVKKDAYGLSPMRRVNGQWGWDPLLRGSSDKERASMAKRAADETAKYQKLAADIEAAKFASVYDAIDVLIPRERPQQDERPQLPREQVDPKTIQGAVWSLGLALEEEDVLAAAKFYHADGPAGAQLAEAHVKHILAAHRFIIAASEIGGSQLAGQFDLIDGRDDLFGHLITEWTIKGDRATGTNEAGPAAAQMRRVDGFWKIDLTPPPGAPPADKLAEQLRRQTKIMAAVTADIREKRLFTVDEIRRELKRRGIAPATPPIGEGEGEVDMN